MIVKNQAGKHQQVDVAAILQMDMAINRCRGEVARLGMHSLAIAYGFLEDEYRHARRSGDIPQAQAMVGRCMAMASQASMLVKGIDPSLDNSFLVGLED